MDQPTNEPTADEAPAGIKHIGRARGPTLENNFLFLFPFKDHPDLHAVWMTKTMTAILRWSLPTANRQTDGQKNNSKLVGYGER